MTAHGPLIRRSRGSATTQRRVVASILALVGGGILLWWGASELLAAGVAADAAGTGGGFPPLALGAAVTGTVAAVWGLCALAWQIGLMLRRRGSDR